MPIGNLLSLKKQTHNKNNSGKRTDTEKKERSKKCAKRRNALQMEPQPKYGVVFAPTNAPSGLTFGQLWQGNASSAKKNVDQIFGEEKLNEGPMKSRTSSMRTRGRGEEKYLAVALV